MAESTRGAWVPERLPRQAPLGWTPSHKREIPLNAAAREAFTQMLNRADELGHTEPVHYIWCASQHHHYDPHKPAEK